MNSLKGYLYILGATISWGISATLARFLFTQHYDAFVLVQMRMTLSCFVLLTAFLIFKRDLLRIRAKDIYKFILMGVIGVAGANYTYYFAIEQTNVATAILPSIFSTPLSVALCSDNEGGRVDGI